MHASDRCMRAPLRCAQRAIAQCPAPGDRRQHSDPPRAHSIDRRENNVARPTASKTWAIASTRTQ
eukprot:735906-Alexandrium_andersonii.AAC.1